MTTLPTGTRMLLGLYNLAWVAALPGLYCAPRLREGFGRRLLHHAPEGFVDVWIQAASAGEAYLARELILGLPRDAEFSVLATSMTSQGLELLERTAEEAAASHPQLAVETAYFPFDAPSLMDKAMERFSPKCAVLLETEIWPGFLAACKTHDVPALVVNARMNTGSLAGYLCASGLFKALAPERVLAVDQEAARRYSLLFGAERVGLMRNIKFDRFPLEAPEPAPADSPVRAVLGDAPCAVFASLRREEGPQVVRALGLLHEARPRTNLAVFPRHMHRLDFWRDALYKAGLTPVMRSGLAGPPPAGSVILWDVFGELSAAYEFSAAAFVGGSLAPLGGQNFLEPLAHGVVPCIGPHWSNFAWVGREIVDQGLVAEVGGAPELAERMTKTLARPRKREAVRARMAAYVEVRRGGTAAALECILGRL